MASTNAVHQGTLLGTISGTALSVVTHLASCDLVKTSIAAGVGAAVSFGVSVLLKWLADHLKRKH